MLVAQWPASRVVVTDLSDVMLALCRQELETTHRSCEWLRLDASRFDDAWRSLRAAESFELLASNALLQWLPDLDSHLAAVRSVLAPAGRYLASSFSTDHFPELRAILEQPPFDFPKLPGVDLAAVAERAARLGLRVVASATEQIAVTYPSPRALLRSLREMGASRYPSAPRLTPSRLELLERTYTSRHSVRDGVICTYRPWYALLSR